MPASAPEGLKLAMHEGGAFASFLLSGSYNQLPEAFPLAIEAVVKSHTRIRETFFIEKYLNDPSKTPEADLKTQILVPVERDV